MHISQVYAENLLPLREGYPLWIPEPDEELPLCYRQSGVRIGDVGVIGQDGGFQFLFNICSSADDPVNQGGVPPSFERIDMGATSYKSTYYSRSGAFVQSADFARKVIAVEAGADAAIVPAGAGFGVEFSVGKDEGAILALPQGGSRRDAKQRRAYEIQIQRHGQEWYTYVRETLGWTIDNGDLYLVTGIDKAATWGALAFRDTQRSHDVSFQFTATPVANAALRHQYQWRHLTSQSARQGPDAAVLMYGDNGAPAENQCVFVRGYKIKMRDDFWSRRRARGLKVSDFTGPRNFGRSTSLKAMSSSLASTSSAVKGKARQIQTADVCMDSANGSSGSFDDVEEGSCSSGNGSSEEQNWSTEDEVSWELVPSSTTPYHPCDALNKFILDNSDCSIAFTHDSLWTCMASDVDVIRDLESQAIFPQYELETIGPGAVTLRLREDVGCMGLGQRGVGDVTMTDAGMSSDESVACRDDSTLTEAAVQENSISRALNPEHKATTRATAILGTSLGDVHRSPRSALMEAAIARRHDSNLRQLSTCPMCSRRFIRHRHLKDHLLLHEDKRKYNCTEAGCMSRFNTRGLRRSHLERVHKKGLQQASSPPPASPVET